MDRRDWRMAAHGLLGLIFTGASMLLGRTYVHRLRLWGFAPEQAQIISALWLIGALLGIGLALWALWRGARGRQWAAVVLGGGGAALAVPNVARAAPYLLAALMGG